ncbi:MAG TPA: Asp23/Gls24 family envelope stress response protein [Anaerolineae bacterium]|nr:Asp23/Gls24 family envelope stress response protein [Anaerolineae bacterium]HIQ06480.1 Asp23/Gls24 family envelope stress response protein [Anaerolineae bacterium]
MSEETELGRIEISPTAIASIASDAVLECYGVVGMASKNLLDGLANAFQKDARRGVEVHLENGRVVVDLYVIVEYGTRISEVAYGVMNRVKFSLEKALGVPVAEVNVHVRGLRISSEA